MGTMQSLELSFYLVAAYLMTNVTVSLSYDGWNQGSSLLPRPTAGGAIGYNPSNNTIWLLGGDGNGFSSSSKQLISFDYILKTFKDYSTFLHKDVFGHSPNYAQIGSTLYITKATSDIHIFNMETMSFTSNYLSTPFPFTLYHCATNIRNEYLVILDQYNDVQILETQSNLWLNSVPSLLIGRRFAACNYINDKLFIIGGEGTTSIEYLDVSTSSMMNIESTSWKYNNDPLPYPITGSRSIAVIDDVLVIGGFYEGSYLNTVYVINSNTESVSLGGYLYKGISKSCVIFVYSFGIIYSFGGNTGSLDKWDGWQTTSVTGYNITTSTSTTERISDIIASSDPITSIIQSTNHENTSNKESNVWIVLLLIACSVCGIFILFGGIVLVKSRDNRQVYNAARKQMSVQKAKNHDDNEVPGQVNEREAHDNMNKHNVLEMRKEESSVSKQCMHEMEGMEQPATTEGNSKNETEGENITEETSN